MPSRQQVSSFIGATFHSVWALELLCFLRIHRDRALSQAEMVAELRGSDLVVSESLKSLAAAGLVEWHAGRARYRPSSPLLDEYAAIAEAAFAASPDAVRRIIARGAVEAAPIPMPVPGG